MEGALRRYSVLSEGATILVQVRDQKLAGRECQRRDTPLRKMPRS